MWADNSNTEIIMDRINKEFNSTTGTKVTPESTEAPPQGGSALLPEHVIGFSYGGQRPHSDHEHIDNPNR